MAHANTGAVFELAHEIASANAPSDLATIWAEHARRQFELATRTAEPLARTVNEAFARGT